MADDEDWENEAVPVVVINTKNDGKFRDHIVLQNIPQKQLNIFMLQMKKMRR
jgi:hypothetical protein